MTISGLANGNFRIEWWSTTTGAMTRFENPRVKDGTLALSVSKLADDVAVKVFPR